MRQCLPGVPILLLGLKSDLRDNATQSGVHGAAGRRGITASTGAIVSEQRARQLAEALGAEGYLECSAKQDIDSIREVFEVIAITSLRYKAYAKPDRTHSRFCWKYDGGRYRWRTPAGIPATYNSGRAPNDVKRSTRSFWSFWRSKSA